MEEKEDKARLQLVKIVRKEETGEYIALMGDNDYLSRQNTSCKSLREAFRSSASAIKTRVRQGLVAMTLDELKQRLPVVEGVLSDGSAEHYKRAIMLIEKHKNEPAVDKVSLGQVKV